MKNQVVQIVEQICNVKPSDCRGIDKRNLARKIMNLANIPQNANISEIPLARNKQANILFLLPDNKNYYSLFAGIGNDGKFYFELSITGTLLDGGYFDFYEEHGKRDQILPIDYFLNRKLNAQRRKTMFRYHEEGQERRLSFRKVYRMFNALVDESQKSQGTTFDSWLAEMEHMQILVRC